MAFDDPYIDPSIGILRNIPKLKTQSELDNFEAEITLWRSAQLIEKPVKGCFDFEHFRAIHKHVFQDIYEWAGKSRTIPIVKMDEEGRSKFAHNFEIESRCHAALNSRDCVRLLSIYFRDLTADSLH